MKSISVLIKPAGLPVPAQRLSMRAGLTIEQIALEKYGSLDGIEAWLRARPDDSVLWREVPREMWRHIRPIRDDVLQFSFRPRGGGSRNLFATVAAIALAVAAPYLAASLGTALGLGTALAVGSLGGSLVASAITIGGSLLLTKLFPAGSQALGFGADQDRQSASYSDVTTDSNVLAKGAFLPIVVGARRMSPPDIINPHPYIRDGVQTIDRAVGLWGKHSLTEVRVDGTPVDSIDAITTDICDGDEATGVYGLIEEISASTVVQEQLSGFALDGTDVEDQITPANSLPRWHAFSLPGHPQLEEFTIQYRLDGFVTSNSTTEQTRIPLRMRMRPKGASTWQNLPEIHVIGREPGAIVRQIRIRWDAEFGGGDVDGEIRHELWREAPAVTAYTLSDGGDGSWESDAHFSNGTGLQDVVNIAANRSGIQIVLDEATFPKTDYEFQVMRGLATTSTSLNSSYQISGVIEPLFVAKLVAGEWVVPVEQGGYLTQVSIPQATAVADEWPTTWPETAKIELRSRGQSVRNITVVAARYVLDWDGSSWATETAASKNPATHYRQILVDWMESRNLDLSLIDNAAFVAWRQECIDRGYECSAVFAGETVGAVLADIAAAGYARPVYGERFSIDYFRDRSSDVPVQLFGLRNTESATFSIVMPERPFGYRATFQNRDLEWKDDEIEVTLGGAADIEAFEAVSYKAIDDPELIRRRATFDLLQVDRRRREWKIDAALEGIICQPGDIVSLVTDLFDDKSHSARVRQVIDSQTLRIDQEIPAVDPEEWADNPDVTDLFDVGESSIAYISTPTGIISRTISNAAENIIVLSSSLPSTADLEGAPINIVAESAFHRVIVTRVEPRDEERATVYAVDEAPEIWTEMQRLFG